jgi:hypothetical protein
MSDCHWLSDRMPAVALGRSTWTAEEASHLGGCRSCQDEWDLMRISGRLGHLVGAGLDAKGTTRALLHRLARSEEEARRRRKAWSFAALASAAAAAAIVWAGSIPVAPTSVPVVASLRIQLPELDNLLPAELNAVLQTMDEPVVGDSVDDPAMGDPDDEDLESGFDTWEG